MIRFGRSLLIAGGLVASLATCVDTRVLIPADNHTAIYLTDAPFPHMWIDRVDIYVVSVSVSTRPDTSASGSFVTVATPNQRFNLLALTNGIAQLIGTGEVPPGPVTAVRMVIDTDSSSMTTVNGFVMTGTTSPSIQWQSSAGRPVLHALVHEQITVPDSGALIVLDFDVGRAFIMNRDINPGSPDSGFVFSPVIRAVDGRRAGDVIGRVRAHTADGEPVSKLAVHLYLGDPAQPENTWSLMGTARTGPIGEFAFSFVTPSAHWATVPAQEGKTYIIKAVPFPGNVLGPATLSNVTVSTGVTTDIGTMILP
jgi:hypothetical protein